MWYSFNIKTMKSFQEFLTETLEPKSDDSQIDKDALEMYKALTFKRTDSDQQVYDILHKCDRIWRNVSHKKWTLDGASIARKFTNPPMIFWLLDYCYEVDQKTIDNMTNGDEDADWILTPQQAKNQDVDGCAVKTKSGTYVIWDPNIASDDSDINEWNDSKFKKIIKMMCDLHHVKYNEQVFKKYDPECFTNSEYEPADMLEDE